MYAAETENAFSEHTWLRTTASMAVYDVPTRDTFTLLLAVVRAHCINQGGSTSVLPEYITSSQFKASLAILMHLHPLWRAHTNLHHDRAL